MGCESMRRFMQLQSDCVIADLRQKKTRWRFIALPYLFGVQSCQQEMIGLAWDQVGLAICEKLLDEAFLQFS